MGASALAVIEGGNRELERPDDAFTLMQRQARLLVASGLLPAEITTPEKATAVMLKARELGIPPMYGLSNIVIVKGKPTCSAELMLALIRRRYGQRIIRIKESTDLSCTVEWRQDGWDGTQTYAWTIEQARNAGLAAGDNWRKYPAAMLRARTISQVARMAFPECISGMYTPDELGLAVRMTDDGEAFELPTGPLSGPMVERHPLPPPVATEIETVPTGRAVPIDHEITAVGRPGPPVATEQDPPAHPHAITRKQRDYILVLCDNPDDDEPLMDEDGRHLLTAWRFDGRMSLNDLSRQEASDLIEFIKDTDPTELRRFVSDLKREVAKVREQTDLPMEPPELGSPEDLATIEAIVSTPSGTPPPEQSELEWTPEQRQWKAAIEKATSERQFAAIEPALPKDKHGNPDRMLLDLLAERRRIVGEHLAAKHRQ